MSSGAPILYRAGRGLLRAMVGFYFARIEQFHRENVPAEGPVLFASNHPNSLTDAFVIGASVARKVNFVATVQLFRFRPLRWLLSGCGVIAINRLKDDPRAMRSVRDTFEACFRVLERGEAVGIFPEGITHDDPQLKTVKTGAARMALELEQRHQGTLGLKIVPVGLTFSAKEVYRSEVLVNYGKPIEVAEYLETYGKNRHEGIQALNSEIEKRIQGLILHLPHLERGRVVEAARRLYLEQLRVGNGVSQGAVTPRAGDLLLTQAIAAAVDRTFAENPERAADFVRKLGYYERGLGRLRLSEEVLGHFPDPGWLLRRSLGWVLVASVGAPVALYGWLHRVAPAAIVGWLVSRTARKPPDKTQMSTATIICGLVVFTIFYGLCVVVFSQFFGWRATVWYGLSLPVTGLAAYYYLRELGRFAEGLRSTLVLLRAQAAGRRLLKLRAELVELIETEREELARKV